MCVPPSSSPESCSPTSHGIQVGRFRCYSHSSSPRFFLPLAEFLLLHHTHKHTLWLIADILCSCFSLRRRRHCSQNARRTPVLQPNWERNRCRQQQHKQCRVRERGSHGSYCVYGVVRQSGGVGRWRAGPVRGEGGGYARMCKSEREAGNV